MTTITYSPLDDGYDFFITDKWKKEYHFKILSFDVPSGVSSIAIEVAEETESYFPRRIEVLSDYDVDIKSAEMRLKAKIKKEINQKSLEIDDYGFLSLKDDRMVGDVLAISEVTMTEPIFSVDGKKITLQQFYKMLEPYSSFKFRFDIIDPSE